MTSASSISRPESAAVRHGVANLLEEVEMSECVAGLALRDRAKQSGDIGIAIRVCLAGEVAVPPVGIALASKRLLQTVEGPGTLRFGMYSPCCYTGDRLSVRISKSGYPRAF